MSKLIHRAVNAIIRPPRTIYEQNSIPQSLQGDDGVLYMRHPLGFINNRNTIIIGSYYYGPGMDPVKGGPCVLYLHGNSSSQFEGQFLVPNLCKYGIFVCCFDFAGCGCSGGDYVSLGYFEKQDTEFLINQLHTYFGLGPFILWGRSMGAATALLVDSPLVVGRISDSSFTSVPDMCGAIAISMHLPSMFVPAAIWLLKKQVVRQANFDIKKVSPISIHREKEVPAIFGHAVNDKFIPFEQCQKLYDNYSCPDKSLMKLDGEHNSKRDIDWIRKGVTFILKNFGIEVKNPEISICRKLQQSNFHFSSFSAMVNETENANISSSVENEFLDQFMEEEGNIQNDQTNGENGENDENEEEEENPNSNNILNNPIDITKCYADFICNGE